MQCQNQDHQNAPITRICLMKQCPKKKQLLCGECVLQDHNAHSQHCISVKDLILKRQQFGELLKERPFQNQTEVQRIQEYFEEYYKKLKWQINQIKEQILYDIQSLQNESILQQDITNLAEDLLDEEQFFQKIENIRDNTLSKITNQIDNLTQLLFQLENSQSEQKKIINKSSKLQKFFEANRLKLPDIPIEYKLIKGFLGEEDNYIGEFFKNKKYGRGYLILDDCYIEGVFQNNQCIWGRRFQNDQDGNPYYLEGEIQELQVIGKGIIQTKIDLYEGDIVNGIRNGQGIAKSQGLCYEGEWKDNMRHGYGIEYYSSGDWNGRLKYEGYWINDKKQGEGVLYYEDGSKYEGEWQENIAQGQGKIIHFNGAMQQLI